MALSFVQQNTSGQEELIVNNGDSDFLFMWDSKEFCIPAGESMAAPQWLVDHLLGNGSIEDTRRIRARFGKANDVLSRAPYRAVGRASASSTADKAPKKAAKKEEPEFEGAANEPPSEDDSAMIEISV
jgi:hypothetical protein